MEVHLLDRLAVRLRLGRGEGRKDGERRVADGRRQGRFLEQETDGPPIARRLLADRLDENPRAANRAGTCRPRRDTDALDAEPRNGVLDGRQGNARVDQGAEDHVSAGAGERIEDGDTGQADFLPDERGGRIAPGRGQA